MIPVFKPLIEKEEIAASVQSLEMGWLGMGSYVNEFEQKVTEILGTTDRYVAAVSTGTAGLHIALIVAGVKEGDEVIISSFNCSADFQAISWVGAEIVFCDCDDTTLAIDLEKAEKLITPKTRAIIAMDYDCMLCDHDKLKVFAEKFNLRVIHDAAHAFGSSYNGKPIGSFSDICIFSHDPVKTITCLDGGVIVVKTKEELAQVHELRLLGMQQPSTVMYQNKRAWTFDVERIGFRYHMLNMHAAVGLAQLNKLDIIRESRQKACLRYNKLLQNMHQVRTPQTDFSGVNPFLYYIRVPAKDRDNLRDFLRNNDIDTGVHWQPGHWFSLWKDCRAGDLQITENVGNEILSLPLHSKMELNIVDTICKSIKEYFENQKKDE